MYSQLRDPVLLLSELQSPYYYHLLFQCLVTGLGAVEITDRHVCKVSGWVRAVLVQNGSKKGLGITKPLETEVSRGFGCPNHVSCAQMFSFALDKFWTPFRRPEVTVSTQKWASVSHSADTWLLVVQFNECRFWTPEILSGAATLDRASQRAPIEDSERWCEGFRMPECGSGHWIVWFLQKQVYFFCSLGSFYLTYTFIKKLYTSLDSLSPPFAVNSIFHSQSTSKSLHFLPLLCRLVIEARTAPAPAVWLQLKGSRDFHLPNWVLFMD